MMPKSDTIDAIRELNPTANPDFLAGFPKQELARYLERLTDTSADGSVRGAGPSVAPEQPSRLDRLAAGRAP